MLFDRDAFSSFQKLLFFLGLMAFKLILILAWNFWRFYKHRIFQYKNDTISGGQNRVGDWIYYFVWLWGLGCVIDGVRKDFIFKTIFIFHNGDKLRNDCVTPLDCVFLIEALFFLRDIQGLNPKLSGSDS
jgi:hypothetical protein